jgi:glucan phosphorylase
MGLLPLLEFLPGRLLRSYLLPQGLYEACRNALADFNVDLEELWELRAECAPAMAVSAGSGRWSA